MDKVFNKVFIGFGILFAGLQLFQAGEFMHDQKITETIMNVLLAIFWVFLVWILAAAESRRSKDEMSLKALKAQAKLIDELTKFMDGAIEEKRNHDLIEAIIKDVVDKGKPSQKHVAKIVPAIYENTGLYAQVSVNKEGGFDVGLSKEPIVPAAPAKRSAARKPAAKKPAVAKAAPATKKPVTKKGSK